MLYFYVYYHFTYIITKTIFEQPQGAWKRFFSVIVVNILNKDQVSIKVIRNSATH